MGTTLLGLVIAEGDDGPVPVVFHIGDSRCYERRGGRLRRVTADHSEVQELIDAGVISPDEARAHPAKNVVTRSLGYETSVTADFSVLDFVAARIMLCTDGVTAELHDDDIEAELRSVDNPQVVADRILDRALSGHARDNMTVLVIDLMPAEAPDDDDDVTEPRVQESNVWAPQLPRRLPRTPATVLFERPNEQSP